MKEKPEQRCAFYSRPRGGTLSLGKVNPGVRTVFLSVRKKDSQTQIRGTQKVCFSPESARSELSKLAEIFKKIEIAS